MRVTSIIFLFWCLCSTFSNVLAQKYRIEAKAAYMCGCFGYELQNTKVTIGGQSQTTSSIYVGACAGPNTPMFDYTFSSSISPTITIETTVICDDGCSPGPTCDPCIGTKTESKTFLFSGTSACYYQTIQFNNLSCSSTNNTFVVGLTWTPVYDPPTNESITQSGVDICEGTNLTLSTASGYTNYSWQYKDSGMSSFQSFYTSPGTTSSVSFGIDKVYGPSYQSKLGNNNSVQFQVGLGYCPKILITDPISFFPKAPQIESDDFAVTDPNCNGDNGSVTISSLNRLILSGETLNISIFDPSADVTHGGLPIANGQKTDVTSLPVTFDDIPPGDYKFFVYSYDYQCGDVDNPLVTNFTISEPTPVTFTNPPTITLPSCNNATTGTINDGSITVAASGGSGTTYEYSKNDGATYQASNVLSGLTTGNYLVQVRNDKGCESDSVSIFVSQPSDINITENLVVSNYNGSDISCVGSTNGQIKIEATGNGALTYFDGGSFVPGNISGGHIFNGLGAGNHTLTVKDGNGCTKNSSPIPIAAPTAISASLTPTAATCNGQNNGSIEVVNPSGGTMGLKYSIGGSFQGSTTFSNLLGNNYIVTIQDSNQCKLILNTTVTQPAAIGISATPTLVTCAGGNDGSVTITATNTVGTPMYSLNGGTPQELNTFSGLSATTHSILVEDGNGCSGSDNVTISSNAIITGPITITTPISCNGGSNGALNLTPGGGVGPYTYTWSNGAMSEDITGLIANTYTVTVKDSKNCQQIFNRVLTQPLPITVNYTTSDYNGSNVSCFGGSNGSINITASGGNTGYTFAWSNGSTAEDISGLTANTYSVTVTDNKSCTGNQSVIIEQPTQLITTISNAQNIACFGGNTGSITLSTTGGTTNYEYSINNGANWQSAAAFISLTANSYTILTRDANSCSDSDGTTLTSPANLVLTIDNTTNTTCNQSNGSAIASAVGGVSSYSYNWFNSSDTQIGSNNTINNLAAGVYRVVVTDQNSCSKQQNVTISSSNGPAVTIQSITPASCSNTSDGSATISITQGQTPYSILWPNSQTTETATNLAGGDYIVEVRDNTNCLSLQTVTIPAPPVLTIQTINKQDPNCFGNSDGEIEVAAQGGNTNYTYSWNTGSTSTTLINLLAGTYTVTVKDIKNCEATEQYTLTNPPLFTINLGADQKICEGQTIVKESDVDNAMYAWTGPNNFTSDQQQVSLTQPGTYTLIVINQNGCEAEDSFELSYDTDLLKADFLMVSEAYMGDTIIVIDISWPLPTSISWQFDQAATIIDQSPDYSLVRYDVPGTYNVSLQAQLAQCASSYNQWITIIENPNESPDGRITEGIIKEVSVYPNPASEGATVSVELNRHHDAIIEMYHLNNNQRIYSISLREQASYKTEMKLNNFLPGIYIIILKAGKEVRSVKLIKF